MEQFENVELDRFIEMEMNWLKQKKLEELNQMVDNPH